MIQAPACWKSAGRSHVTVRALWDGPHTHDDFGPPMYELWRRGSFHTVLLCCIMHSNAVLCGRKHGRNSCGEME